MHRAEAWLCWFALLLPLGAAQPGEIVGRVRGLAVAARVGGPAQTILQGSPALVLGVQKDSSGREWVRLLAADGKSGWTPHAFGAGTAARIPGAGALELSDRSPDQASFAEGIETITVPRHEAKIVGASAQLRVASLDQLMLPARLNPFLMPWLEIRAGERQGWIVPPELPLEWGAEARGREWPTLMDELGLEGIVRAPFLGAAGQRLAELSAEQAPVLEFAEIGSKPKRTEGSKVSGQTVEALVRLESAWVAALSGSDGVRLLFSRGGSALVGRGTPVIVGAAAGDLNGDGKKELVLHLAGRYGDGYTTALWVVSGAEKGLEIRSIALSGASGEPGGGSIDASWWLDGLVLWIARVEVERVAYTRVGGSGLTGYAVIGGTYSSRDAADQRAIALTQGAGAKVQVFPVNHSAKSPLRWAAGRIFGARAEADRWRKSLKAATTVRAIAVTAERR